MSHMLEHGFEQIHQGAEAKLFLGTYLGRPTIIKERFSKSYRHPQLDASLNKERTKSEAKSIVKSSLCGIRTPTLYLVDYLNGLIYMEYVENSITVKDYIKSVSDKIEKNPDEELIYKKVLNKLTEKIGHVLGQMHENNIVHGDLTTSNMLLEKPENYNGDEFSYDDGEIVMLDFGLSHINTSAEDKGVDLYVLERALTSTHSSLPYIFGDILHAYKKNKRNQSKDILIKLEDIRARGRKRTMVG